MHKIVPQLCLAGLPPSLQGLSAWSVAPDEDFRSGELARLQHRKRCMTPTPGNVPPLYLAGLRPSLQGCYGLGAPPSEEEIAVNDVPLIPFGPRMVPPLDLGGLRPSLQGCSGLGAPPSEEIALNDS